MSATTPGERKALLFIACVAVLGSGARYTQARRAEQRVPAASVRALERQLAVVDSVRAGTGDRGRGMRRADRRSQGRASPDSSSVSKQFVPHPPSPIPAVVDVDLASAAELERLPGIGPALARRIVADRDSLGPFGVAAGAPAGQGRGAGARGADRTARDILAQPSSLWRKVTGRFQLAEAVDASQTMRRAVPWWVRSSLTSFSRAPSFTQRGILPWAALLGSIRSLPIRIRFSPHGRTRSRYQ